jgi:hypothetical protein
MLVTGDTLLSAMLLIPYAIAILRCCIYSFD